MKLPAICIAPAVAAITAATVACHSFTPPHEVFKNNMGANVGRKVDAPGSYIARYPEDVIGEKKLPNGNLEIEYYAGYRGRDCTVFFEVDHETQIIIGWRFVGTEESCVIVP